MMIKRFIPYCTILFLAGWLVACGGDTAVPIGSEPALSPYQIILVSTDFGAGQPRVSFVLYDGADAVTDIEGVHLTAVDISDEENQTVVWQGEATGYTDYEIPYWVAYPEINQGGYWGMVADITHGDGSRSETTFVIEVRGQSLAPAIGDQAPASQNRTAADTDLSLLNSGNETNPALYQMTVAEAIASGKPSVVGFITPGLCQTEWCTPVLASVESVWSDVGEEQANFIHIEVYADFQELTVVPEMGEWRLNSEPWVFVLDENGRVAAKFSGPVSPRELNEALLPLLEG
jgi:thiol-disulfide isomerase/thioredoxin